MGKDDLSCGMECAKILLICFNIIFWISGAVVLSVGIWTLLDSDFVEYLNLIVEVADHGKLVEYAGYMFCAVGGIVFLIGFCGCCGAWKEVRCMLICYIILMGIVILAQLGAGVLGVLFKTQLENKMMTEFIERMTETVNDDWTATEKKGFVSATIKVQETFQCCGWSGFTDYESLSLNVPESCEDVDCADTANPYYKKGCREGVDVFIEENSTVIIGFAFGIAGIEILGFILAICLCKALDK